MAWNRLESKNGYAIYEETGLVLPDSAGANVTTINTSTIPDEVDLTGKKFVVYLEVTEASGGNGSLDLALQGSLDDSNFVDLDSSAGIVLDSTGLNKAAGVIDLSSDEQAPYYQLQVFSDGTDILDSATVTVKLAVKGKTG